MAKKPIIFETLVNLIGLERSDQKFSAFINQFIREPVSKADGEESLDHGYVEIKPQGIAFYFEKNSLKSVFLYSSDNEDGYIKYDGTLPVNIRFNHNKSEIIEMLGHPNYEGGGYVDNTFGNILPWIKYEMNGYFLHLEFNSDLKSIKMVTIDKSL